MRKLMLVLALSLFPMVAAAQAKPCVIGNSDPVNNTTVCDLPAFKLAFANAKYVSYNRSKLDDLSAKQLRDMLTSFGKQIVSDSDHPGLFFELTQPDLNGIFVGPAGVVLARLRVYTSGSHTLLWEETYTDQPDVPWPSAVLYLLQNFRNRITK
jgi:hypothetical protein